MKFVFSLILFLINGYPSVIADSKIQNDRSINLMTSKESVKNALNEYAWKKRQLIIFSPSKNDAEYLKFKQLEEEYKTDLEERKLHTWFINANEDVRLNKELRKDISNRSFRNLFKVPNNELTIILLAYDQGERLRSNKVDIEYIFSKIDQMPMRIQEMNSIN